MAAHIPTTGNEPMINPCGKRQTVTNFSQCLPASHRFLFCARYSLLIPLIAFLFFITFAASEAEAAGVVAINYCTGAPMKGMTSGIAQPLPIQRLIMCFTDMGPTFPAGYAFDFTGPLPAPNGLIPQATFYFLSDAVYTAYAQSILDVIIAFAILVFSWKLLAGDLQSPKGETAILLIKIAGTWFFLTEAPYIYADVIGIFYGINSMMEQAILNVFGAGSTFCNLAGSPSPTGTQVWGVYDCLYGWVTGEWGVAGFVTIVTVLLLIAVFTGGTGVVLLFGFLYLLFAFFSLLARFLQIYIMSFMLLSFMFLIGYLFMPFIFFKNTFHYFQKWMAITLAYILLPCIMYAYMGMVAVAIDQGIISGQYSVMHELFDHNTATPPSAMPQLNGGTRVQCPTDGNRNGVMANSHHRTGMYFGHDNSGSASNVPTDVGTMGGAADTNGNGMSDNGIQGSKYDAMNATTHGQSDMGFDYCEADVPAMANQQGGKKSVEQFIFDIGISIIVAVLLIYICYSLTTYVFDMIAELVSQGTSAGRGAVKAEVFGVAAVKHALDLAKEAALTYASGGSSLAKKGAEVAQQQAAQRSKPKGDDA